MPTTTLMPLPKQNFSTVLGTPLVGGKVFTYAAGGTVPKPTYTDAAGTVEQTNPIVLNLRGEPPAAVYWSGNYRVEVRDALNNLVYTVDNFNTDPAGLWGFASGVLANLPTAIGASLVGFMQSGAGAILRTLQDKGRELFSLNDFGGTDSGSEASDAETKGITASTAVRSLFRSLWMYKFPRRGIKVWKRTFGIKDMAAVVSINGGDDTTEPITQVLGFATDSDVSLYGDRDHVALFVQNQATPPLVQTAVTTFTANSVTSTAFAPALAAKSVQIGMLIDTTEATKKTGVITGFDATTNTITVSAWYIVDGTRNVATPANGTTVNVNPSTKVWALNANVLLPANAQANSVVGFELGLVNDKADGMGYLYDGVNLGSKKGGTAFQSRGGFIEGFHAFTGTQFGFISSEATSIGFYAQVGPIGFQSDGATAISYLAKNSSLALVVQDAANVTKTILDGAGRWNLFKGKLNVFAANTTIDGCYVAALTGTPVNLPDPTGNNAERILFVQNATAVSATAVGPIAGGGGGLVIAAGKCIQVISNGSAWVPLSQY